ncbi:hypothetical protein ACFVUS_25510 [Nocardia sp. NPDC058058]|uniref:hypothetical protein n=1 Tax=Nocardia sp. NPDC058058 TaxID=3346317 RepID=UPI0036DA5F6D
MDVHKSRLDWVDASVYQMAEIAIHTIDQVTLAMDFDTGARHDEVVERVLPFVAAQARERGSAEHRRVARWVLEKLINVGIVDRGFQRVYGEIGPDGSYQRMLFTFQLLREVPGARGGIFLRATDEAINVLVGALDTDVESAQIAAEVKLANLIDRGLLADARLEAEQHRYRTVQYGEKLRHRLEATRRDVRLVDWDKEMPELLDKALGHIEQRFQVEHSILSNIAQTRDKTDDPVKKRRAAELVEIVRECLSRHTQLQNRLQSARGMYRAEQDRQQFSGPPQRSAMNLHRQLLTPILELPVAQAIAPVAAFFSSASGVRVPDALSLPQLVATLLRPPVDSPDGSRPVFVPELADRVVDSRFTEEHWRRTDELLDLPGRVRNLSTVLSEAAEFDADLPTLVALRALHALAPAVMNARQRHESSVMVAVPTDTGMPQSVTGIEGDELLLTTAVLTKTDGIAVAPAREENR